jgi:hypothetical protein
MAEFEPRSAKAAEIDEITYTGTIDKPYTPGAEVPPGASVIDLTEEGADKPKLVLRRFGVQKTLKAKDGVFHPRSAEDVAALNAFDLPVSRETKSEAPKTEKEG